MVFCHIIDDYSLQGILNDLKRKSWWQEHSPGKQYRYDYLAGLLAHGFSWAFVVMLPIAFRESWDLGGSFFAVFVGNWLVHSLIDDLKANRGKLNLVQDQLLHLVQIFVTAFIFCYGRG